MSDQLTPDELAYIANWLSKPEVCASLIKLMKLFMSTPSGTPSMRGPLTASLPVQQGGVVPHKNDAHVKDT